MKQDRFLTGILIGIAALIVVALVIFFVRKDNLVYVNDNVPAGVVQNYVVALHKRDYEKAYGYLASLANKPTLDQFRQSFISHIMDPSSTGIEIGTAEINGDTATVSISIISSPGDPFSTGYRNSDYAQLVLEKDAWKIKQLPYNFWAYDWYQPTAIPAMPVKP
jgi:hypothetical protein